MSSVHCSLSRSGPDTLPTAAFVRVSAAGSAESSAGCQLPSSPGTLDHLPTRGDLCPPGRSPKRHPPIFTCHHLCGAPPTHSKIKIPSNSSPSAETPGDGG